VQLNEGSIESAIEGNTRDRSHQEHPHDAHSEIPGFHRGSPPDKTHLSISRIAILT
jgi:hypothetical protein